MERSDILAKNRTRNKAVTLRLTEEEFAFYEKKFIKSKAKNQTDFFLAALDKKPIVVIEEYKELLVELKRQGINLNQVARKMNEGNQIADELERAIENCNAVYKKLLEVKK